MLSPMPQHLSANVSANYFNDQKKLFDKSISSMSNMNLGKSAKSLTKTSFNEGNKSPVQMMYKTDSKEALELNRDS